jgi:hypothetical protein
LRSWIQKFDPNATAFKGEGIKQNGLPTEA